ncbi:MAG TPA: aquaporin [Thermoplasmata archaeon]|jgi:aquaporin Z|nr:aquaporin [Thermoplasmata archaeon]
MPYSTRQRYLAEFVGSFGLLLAAGGSAVFSLSTRLLDPLARVVLVAMSIGIGVIGMIYAFGDISGGHFNPAVTVGAWLAGKLSTRDVIPYILAQMMGGVLAMGIIAGIAYGNSTFFPTAQASALASQCYSAGSTACNGFDLGAVFLIEVAFTFLLVIVVLLSTRAEGSAKNLAPLGIGLTLLMANLVAIPVDGASINPVRSFAPAVVSSLWSSGNWAIGQDWVFWVAPILGGIFAAILDRFLRAKAAPTLPPEASGPQ